MGSIYRCALKVNRKAGGKRCDNLFGISVGHARKTMKPVSKARPFVKKTSCLQADLILED